MSPTPTKCRHCGHTAPCAAPTCWHPSLKQALESAGVAKGVTRAEILDTPNGYESLAAVLTAALDHAAVGKGHDRHANGRPFAEQPMQKITRMVGLGFPLGQAMKKAQEAGGMADRGEHDAARSELLGAVNYLAGAVMWLEAQK